MIETKEQYEVVLELFETGGCGCWNCRQADQVRPIIEALREVARAADEISSLVVIAFDDLDRPLTTLKQRLDALPDWITANENS